MAESFAEESSCKIRRQSPSCSKPPPRFYARSRFPQLSGHAAFHARVAANALDIVKRELELRPAAERAEHARLSALLHTDGSLEELNSLLSRRIAAGELGLQTPGLAAHLWATTLAKVVDRSTHLRVVPTRNRDLTAMDFYLPAELVSYLARLDAFIAAEIAPLQAQNDNERFFDHRRE